MAASVNPFFTPTQISGCQMWLDAADPSTVIVSGSNVTQWNDKSGNGIHANQAIQSAQPTYANRTLVFTSSQTLVNTTFRGFTTAVTIYMVYYPTAVANAYPRALYIIPGSTAWALFDSTQIGAQTTSTGGYTIYGSRHLNQTYIVGLNGTSGSLPQYGINGSTFINTATPYTQTQTTFGYNIGNSNVAAGTQYTGTINEIIVYNTSLALSQRQQIEGYLAWKWGLQASLPIDHPYKRSIIPPLLNPPTTVTSFLQNTSSTFSPQQITGCQLWLDGTDINGNGTATVNNASVSTWKDKSGFSYDFTASVAGTYSSTAQAVVFNNSYYTSSYPANPTNETSFLVFMITTTNKPQIIVGTNAGGRELALYNDGLQFGVINSQTGWGAVVGTITINNPFLATGQVSGGTNSYISLNGSLSLTGPVSVPAFTSGVTTGLGREAGNSIPFYGNLYELVIFNSVLPVAQRQQMEGYLAWKWNMQSLLPRAHPFKSSPPFTPALAFPARSLAVAATWQPTQFSGCELWLDGQDTSSMVLSGSSVTQWNDKSGNNRNGVATGSPFLGKTTTGRQAIYFGGSDFYKLTNNISSFTRANMTWFILASATGDSRNLMHLFGNERIISFQLYYNNQVGNFFFTPSKPFLNTNALCTIVENVGVQCAGFINGTGASSMTQASIAITNAATEIVVGAHGNYTNGWIGNIQEVVIYNTAFTSVQRQQVEGYLAWKWGIQGSLPGNHPWKRWPPSS